MINSLKEVKEINGKGVYHSPEEDRIAPLRTEWIKVDHVKDEISFGMLTKPASEGGDLNRCQWSDLVATGLEQLKYFNAKFPCRENALTITKLEEALMWNEKRTQDRIKRNVEGEDKA